VSPAAAIRAAFAIGGMPLARAVAQPYGHEGAATLRGLLVLTGGAL
jgi:hypothetical protein